MPTVKLFEIKLDHQILEWAPFKTRQTSTSRSGVGEAAAAGLTRVASFPEVFVVTNPSQLAFPVSHAYPAKFDAAHVTSQSQEIGSGQVGCARQRLVMRCSC